MLIFIINVLVFTLIYTLTNVGLNSTSLKDFFENIKNLTPTQLTTNMLGGATFHGISLLLAPHTILAFIVGVIATIIVIMVLERCH